MVEIKTYVEETEKGPSGEELKAMELLLRLERGNGRLGRLTEDDQEFLKNTTMSFGEFAQREGEALDKLSRLAEEKEIETARARIQ